MLFFVCKNKPVDLICQQVFCKFQLLNFSLIILIQEVMPYAFLFVCHNRIQIHIFHTLKNISLHKRIPLLQGADQFLDLDALGTVLLIIAGGTRICEFAGTLDKMQSVIIPPCLDVILPHQIQRADQLHPLKIRAVKLRHHRLHLRAVQHSHQYGFNHIVIVMPQCDLIAAELSRIAVQMSSAHSGAQITGRFFHMINRLKYVRFKYSNGNFQTSKGNLL